MPRTVLRDLGFVILIASVLIGLLPVFAATFSIGVLPDTAFSFGDFQVLRVEHLTTGAANVSVTSAVWIAAAVGELMILGAWLLKANERPNPVRFVG